MKKHCLIIFLLVYSTNFFVPTPSFAENIKKYFKLPNNKIRCKGIRNIDYIYLINLDQRPQKLHMSLQQLQKFGIVPYRYPAVNGWELPVKSLSHLGVLYQEHPMKKMKIMGTAYPTSTKGRAVHEIIGTRHRRYFAHGLSKGAIGIALSHLSILQDAYNSKYQTIWVMEDDIRVIQNPHILSELIDKLDSAVGNNNWDIFFTDQDSVDRQGNYMPCLGFAKRPDWSPKDPTRFGKRSEITPDLRKIGARFGTHSMILRRSGIRKILKFLKKYNLFFPYDMEMGHPENIQMYCVTSDVVAALPNALTDNEAPHYKDNL